MLTSPVPGARGGPSVAGLKIRWLCLYVRAGVGLASGIARANQRQSITSWDMASA